MSFRLSRSDRWFAALLPAALLAAVLAFGVRRPALRRAEWYRAEARLLGPADALRGRLAAAEERLRAAGAGAPAAPETAAPATRAARLAALRGLLADAGVEVERAVLDPASGGRTWDLALRAPWDRLGAALDALAAGDAPDAEIETVALLDAPRRGSALLWRAKISP